MRELRKEGFNNIITKKCRCALCQGYDESTVMTCRHTYSEPFRRQDAAFLSFLQSDGQPKGNFDCNTWAERTKRALNCERKTSKKVELSCRQKSRLIVICFSLHTPTNVRASSLKFGMTRTRSSCARKSISAAVKWTWVFGRVEELILESMRGAKGSGGSP